MTITGVGFAGVSEVRFKLEEGVDDAQVATDLAVSGDTQITCTTPEMTGAGKAVIVFFRPDDDTGTLAQGGEFAFQ